MKSFVSISIIALVLGGACYALAQYDYNGGPVQQYVAPGQGYVQPAPQGYVQPTPPMMPVPSSQPPVVANTVVNQNTTQAVQTNQNQPPMSLVPPLNSNWNGWRESWSHEVRPLHPREDYDRPYAHAERYVDNDGFYYNPSTCNYQRNCVPQYQYCQPQQQQYYTQPQQYYTQPQQYYYTQPQQQQYYYVQPQCQQQYYQPQYRRNIFGGYGNIFGGYTYY